MRLRLSVWHKLLLLVLVPLLFEVGFVSSLALLLSHAEQQTDRYEQVKEISLRINSSISKLFLTMFKWMTCFSSGAQDVDIQSQAAIESCKQCRATLAETAQIRPEIADTMRRLPLLLDRLMIAFERTFKITSDPNAEWTEQLKLIREMLFPLLMEFREASDAVMQREDMLTSMQPAELRQIKLAIIAIMGGGIFFGIILSVVAAKLFSNDVVKRLKRIEQNAQLLAIRAPFDLDDSGSDEIAAVEQALKDADRVLSETRRKELAILDVATDVICSLDKRYRFTAIGAAALPSWGFEPDDLLGHSLLSLHLKECEPAIRGALESIAQDESDTQFDGQLICKDGTIKDFLWKVSWVRATQSYYCVAHDISERRAAERLKQRFISIASHDLRTPLSSISAILNILTSGGKGELPEKAGQVLTKADASLERLMDLIRDLLDLEKLEAGKVVMSMSAVSALDVCLDSCDSLEYLAKSLGVTIVRPHMDAALHGDERSLVRVVVNLLSNAIKFSPRGGSVNVSVQAVNSSLTEISVADQGPGIPKEDQQMIFEKFSQSKSGSGDTKIKGTGLGLAISKLIAEAHGGTIGVQSEEGKGSRFFIRIPNFISANDDEADQLANADENSASEVQS